MITQHWWQQFVGSIGVVTKVKARKAEGGRLVTVKIDGAKASVELSEYAVREL
ncbi:hypothetical protein [Bradyrhizobium arachidis]|uniref:hypothetical protein n=1 Tax=Bradyrhizobium arachidis TaxID=858423 RepID=UPI002162BEE8|nr:hypothetical protein [Bradyrhizobium arachidis]UVO30741.1 hypothetical protein KUF59_08845 [Bradyrhizobium arachidis]